MLTIFTVAASERAKTAELPIHEAVNEIDDFLDLPTLQGSFWEESSAGSHLLLDEHIEHLRSAFATRCREPAAPRSCGAADQIKAENILFATRTKIEDIKPVLDSEPPTTLKVKSYTTILSQPLRHGFEWNDSHKIVVDWLLYLDNLGHGNPLTPPTHHALIWLFNSPSVTHILALVISLSTLRSLTIEWDIGDRDDESAVSDKFPGLINALHSLAYHPNCINEFTLISWALWSHTFANRDWEKVDHVLTDRSALPQLEKLSIKFWTYLDAADELGEETLLSLLTDFRVTKVTKLLRLSSASSDCLDFQFTIET
ncbi:hypothetical protein BYT27DRAFT_7253927 [Phlegmacium glaucopus]|nr:hypothetical protein BYT27DRAFT_7253927 [Phlegmacium glaucopus]